MWLAEMVKRRLGGLFQGDKTCPLPPLKCDDSEKDVPGPDDDFHGLEAGQWPGHVPSPGYLGVGLSYVSLALCVAGIVTLHRCTIIQVRRGNLKLYSFHYSFHYSLLFYQEDKKLVTLLVSLVMITSGIIVFILANRIFKREQKELTDHIKVNLVCSLHLKLINEFSRFK